MYVLCLHRARRRRTGDFCQHHLTAKSHWNDGQQFEKEFQTMENERSEPSSFHSSFHPVIDPSVRISCSFSVLKDMPVIIISTMVLPALRVPLHVLPTICCLLSSFALLVSILVGWFFSGIQPGLASPISDKATGERFWLPFDRRT